MSANNPYGRGARWYDLNLALPLVSTLRRQEHRAVGELISRYAEPQGRAIEVGPGTGFYTLAAASAFGEVVAVEESAQMTELLTGRLQAAEMRNVTVLNRNFLALGVEGDFDVALAIGVLDYIADPRRFVAKLCAAARRAVILTAPQRGLWGDCFAAAARLRGITVYRYRPADVSSWAPAWRPTVVEVGLKTPLTRGMTLVAALERPE